MTTLILAIAFATLLTPPAYAGPREDAVVACLIGQAGVALHNNLGRKMDARTATDAAMVYADKRCGGGRLIGDEGGDYVYHSIHGMAKAWFEDKDDGR